MPLFPRADLDTYGFGQTLGESEILHALDRLARLQHLHRSGYWSRLKESNVEQSFVERVFADVFGYSTLLSRGRGADVEHEVMPKVYVPLAGAARAFPDFALGFFRADQQETVVSAELKSPGANLDDPQGGNYGGKSPVQQAMLAASNARAEWCIVSNTNELRLYRVPDEENYERAFLLDVESPASFRRAYALFSRRSLLGKLASTRSPLSTFHAHMAAGESMLVPARPDRIRLVQRIRPRLGDSELPFTRLSAAFERAFATVPSMNVLSGEFVRPRLESDQLVFDRVQHGDVWQRISATKSGLLVSSFSLPLDGGGSPDLPILIDPAEVTCQLADMIAFGWKFFEPLTKKALVFEWTLEDLSVRARVNDRRKWTRPTPHTSLVCQASVASVSFPEVSWSHGDGIARSAVMRVLGDVVRELFFPFEGIDDSKRLCRLEPTAEEFSQLCDESKLLAVFP